MIKSKKELKFCINADYMMNRGYFEESILKKLISVIYPDWIMKYLVALCKQSSILIGGGTEVLL